MCGVIISISLNTPHHYVAVSANQFITLGINDKIHIFQRYNAEQGLVFAGENPGTADSITFFPDNSDRLRNFADCLVASGNGGGIVSKCFSQIKTEALLLMLTRFERATFRSAI